MKLEPITMGITPLGSDPMALVGLPVWMWVAEPDRTSWGPATIRAGGLSLTAGVRAIEWSMGDGAKVSCGLGTRWVRGNVDRPSPMCGHTYTQRGIYTVIAASHCVARWSGYGRSGEIALDLTKSRELKVVEFTATSEFHSLPGTRLRRS